MTFEIAAPKGFSLRRTVLSHGWYDLSPFRWDGERTALAVTLPLPGGARSVRMTPSEGGVVVEAPGRAGAEVLRRGEAAVRRILQLDLDLGEFHRRLAADPKLAWIAERRLGRLLRAPTVFEDLVKLVLTTNCSWSLTRSMVGNLVDRYGEAAPDGTRAFPGPKRLAGLSEREWREAVRAGYRSPSLVQLCRSVAEGEIEPESWEESNLDPADLRKQILLLPGVGPYVAENLLKFLGRPDGLALDSWMRTRYAEKFHGGRRVTDRTIARRMGRLGPWAGLALWFELIEQEKGTGTFFE